MPVEPERSAAAFPCRTVAAPARWLRIIAACCFFAGCPINSTTRAGNFVCVDPQLAAAAEAARASSALFWAGCELPDWSRPCPITVQSGGPSGCGWTRFTIQRGEVFGWSMTIRGDRGVLVRDVIPHEVDHMLRVSLTRRPIERWLDEGCAALMESMESHERLRRIAGRIDSSWLTPERLALREYPHDPCAVAEGYACGFVLVELLLTRHDARTLLELQRRNDPWPQRLNQLYGLSWRELQRGWDRWRTARVETGYACGACGCLRHIATAGPPAIDVPRDSVDSGADARETLTIWTAAWCGPCQRFWNDFEQQAELRTALTSRFRIVKRDFDAALAEAARAGIRELPAFVTRGGRVTGYTAAGDLLSRLEVISGCDAAPDLRPIESPPAPPAKSPPTPAMPIPAVASDGPTTSDAAAERRSESSPRAEPASARLARHWEIVAALLPWAGWVGGAVVSGGAGAALAGGVWLGGRLARRRADQLRRRATASSERRDDSRAERSPAVAPAPFPRQLDEAGELLALRRSEGRVAVLDALRGMFLDDELDKLARADAAAAPLVGALRSAIDQRVADVAPLSTEVNELA